MHELLLSSLTIPVHGLHWNTNVWIFQRNKINNNNSWESFSFLPTKCDYDSARVRTCVCQELWHKAFLVKCALLHVVGLFPTHNKCIFWFTFNVDFCIRRDYVPNIWILIAKCSKSQLTGLCFRLWSHAVYAQTGDFITYHQIERCDSSNCCSLIQIFALIGSELLIQVMMKLCKSLSNESIMLILLKLLASVAVNRVYVARDIVFSADDLCIIFDDFNLKTKFNTCLIIQSRA